MSFQILEQLINTGEDEMLYKLAKNWVDNSPDINKILLSLETLKVQYHTFAMLKRIASEPVSDFYFMDTLLHDIFIHIEFTHPITNEDIANHKEYEEKLEDTFSTDLEADFQHIKKIAMLGFPTFQFLYAFYSLSNITTENDLIESFQWMERAATQGYPPAQFLLGVMFLHGLGETKSEEKGLGLIKRSYENNYLAYYVANIQAQYEIGDEYDETGAVSKFFKYLETGEIPLTHVTELQKIHTTIAENKKIIQKANQLLEEGHPEEKIHKIICLHMMELSKIYAKHNKALSGTIATVASPQYLHNLFPAMMPTEWVLGLMSTPCACIWTYSESNNSSDIFKKVKDIFWTLLFKTEASGIQKIYERIIKKCTEQKDYEYAQRFAIYWFAVSAKSELLWDETRAHLVLIDSMEAAFQNGQLNEKEWFNFVSFLRIHEDGEKPEYPHGGSAKMMITTVLNKIKNIELEKRNRELEQKEQELEEMMAMFAHKFRSPLDAILYNTSHGNTAEIYERHAQTMRGLLDIFSLISTDQDVLVNKLAKDIVGDGNLQKLLEKGIDMVLLHLLTESGSDKIHQHFLSYAKKTDAVAQTTNAADWYNEYYDLEDELRVAWQREYAKLIETKSSLEDRLKWIEQYFFKLEITGFDNSIRFKEYGITESFLVIVINEILTNLFKYYSSDKNESAQLNWQSLDGYQTIKCSNPSVKSERLEDKGSYKGHKFLSGIARKTGSKFEKPEMQDNFSLEFLIPNNVLIKGETE